jgi:WD40 repeat protein
VDTPDGIGFFGFSPDGRTLYALSGYQGGGSGALHWLDAQTLRESRPARQQIHEASPKSIAMSDDGSLLATGASDGFVRVWAAASGDLVHEISFGPTEIQGVAFIAVDHLAVATRVEGSVLHFTLDQARLIDIVRASLTRTFTEVECSRYDIEPCPSLDELRGG